MKGIISAASAAALLAAASPALAQSNEITVGVTISATGPAAALGIPIKNTIELLPTEIGGVKVKIIQLDDAGDSDDGDHQRPPPDHRIQGRRADRLLDHAADDRRLDGRQ